MKALLIKIRQILKDRRARRFLTRFVSGTAAIVVFITTYALILPAITMESQAACGIEAHQHDDSCYSENLICGQEESEGHHHTDDCYTVTEELVCQIQEHQHSSENGCFDEDGNLVCTLQEHTHGDSCYQEKRELTCGLEETEGHHHTDSCYEKVLTCGKEAHTHSAACYEANLEIESAAVASTGMTSAAAVPEISDQDYDPEDSQADAIVSGSGDGAEQTTAGEEQRDDEISLEDNSKEETEEDSDAALEADNVDRNDGTAESNNDVDKVNETGKNSSEEGEEAASSFSTGFAAEENAENGGVYIPEKEELYFNTVLNGRTGIYYHHVAENEEIEDSSVITDWHKADGDTELNPEDLIRMYLSYTLPEDTINATNDIARYHLPDALHLTDAQIEAINNCENGISAQYIDYDNLEITDPGRHTAYLGMESVEGSRRPGEELNEGSQEFISAVVRVEKIYDEETDEYLGTDLIFTFSPYTVEKNARAYDKEGQPTRAGEKVTGWLTLDFNMGQIDWAEDNTSEIVFANEDQENKISELKAVLRQVNPADAETDESAADGTTEAAAEFASEEAAGYSTEEAATAAATAETAAQNSAEDAAAAATTEQTAADGTTEALAAAAATEETAAENSTEDVTTETASAATTSETAAEGSSEKTDADARKDSENEKDNKEELTAANYPAAVFDDSITVRSGRLDTDLADTDIPKKTKMTVHVEADEGTFPKGTKMVLSAVEDLDAVAEAVGTAVDEKKTRGFQAVDITFYDKDPSAEDAKEIEPLKPIRVSIKSDEIKKAAEDASTAPVVVHIEDDNTATEIENTASKTDSGTIEIEKPGVDPENTSDSAIQSNHEQADPEQDNELKKNTDSQESGDSNDSLESIVENEDKSADTDDSVDKGKTATADETVDTDIAAATNESAASMPENEKNTDEDESTANISEYEESADKASTGSTVEFEADSFSVYAIVYTVDFHWEVDGKTYEFKIPGGGFISFEQLVEVLGITGDTNSSEKETNDIEKSASETDENNSEGALLTLDDVVVSEETRKFVADVESVDFSKPELVWVRKVDADSTVGKLKEINGLECQYSAELTEEQIAEINAQTVKTGDWAMISMLPFDTEESLTVTMKNGEQFVVKVTDSQDPLGLDGRTFSIVNNRNNNWYALRGERNTTTQNTRGYYLFADSVSHTIANNTEYCGIGADAWLFEYNADEKAYYVSCNGMYLYIDPTITSKTQSDPNNQYAHALDLKAEKDQSDKGTLLKISRDADGNYIFKSNSENITLWDYNNNTYWLSNESQETNSGEVLNSHMRLCLPEASGSNASHKATLISAADTQPGQKIIIYQRVLDPTTDTFTYYAINGKGGMEKVYNSSDSVYWKGDLNIEWTLKDLGNGYCTLYNEKENTYLTPKASKGTDNSFVVHKASDFDGSKHLNISLPGRDDGTYTSLISCWDYVDNATYGLKASETSGGGQVAIEPLLTSQPFYFAARDPIVHDQLTTVDTVDSVSKGIKITMYDWGDERGLDSHRQNWDGNNPAIQDRLPFMQGIMGATNSYADKYESGKVKPGILANYIDKENGQTAPNILNENGTGNGHNLSELFSDSYIRTGTTAEKVNHLFLQSVYDETGFFKYSCFENYAYLPQGNDFTVYEQIGTPSNRTKDSTSTNIIYERGNFMPYNPINAAMNYRQNNYDPDLKELPDGDPRKGERLYYIENANPNGMWVDGHYYRGSGNPEAYANYYIGMKMEAKFSQNPGGYADNGDPMVFEFNGDDDLWIYLDNVLVLDMGGVHDAFRGKINFRTGDVTCNALNGENTTIKAMFKKAGRFPDGTEWDDARVNEYFRGNTFKDFTTHNFKMFYMERGASASDLEMMFNLPVLTESQFRIKKELPETNDGEVVQSQYGDAPFYYKAYVYDAEAGSMVTCTRQYLSSKGLDTPKYEDGSEVEWLTTNSNEEIFLIKPGQTALFPAIDDSVRWYTEEVAPPQNENMLKKFSVSNSDQDNDINYEVGVKSKERTILVRNMVIYQNRPDTELVNELQIKKKINGNAYNADDSFEYRIYLEKTDGKLGVYRLGEYYQFDKDNNFVFYENGVRHTAKMEVLTNGHYRYYHFDDERPEETVEVQKITEHTSTNGSVGDVRDGDTIIIKGLLVGTDFYVYERTDYSYMSPDSTPVEGKYVFEGTDVTDAYTRNPETNKPENELIFNSLYGPPDSEAINSYPHSAYEREKAASGAIIEHKDAKILVKNKPYLEIPEGTISVEKKWLDEDNHDITSTVTDKSVTYDIYRLVHVHEMECIVDQEPTDTEPGVQHFKCKHDGCDYVLPPEQIEPKGHQWSEWEEKHRKTCTEQGIWERHCLNPGCNATETWTEEPLGHDWDDGVITQPATTTQTGIRHHVCQNDSSHTWDEEIPKLVGNISYHIRDMYNYIQGVQIGSYQSDGTISAGTGNAIRVSYTLKSNNPDEKWAYGNSSTTQQMIPKTQKYIDYNYYYDYSVIIPIEEGKELYLYLGSGYNSSRSNFKIEVIEYYDQNTMNAMPKLLSKSSTSAISAIRKRQNSTSDGPTNYAELNEKLARIGYSETDEQTHTVVNHNFYQWDKYDSASQSWKTDGVSAETLQNGRWSKTYTVPLTDENGNPYEYYFIEKSITPEGEVAHWTTTYTNQDGGLTASGIVTINNKKVPEKGSLLITKNVTYNGGTPVPAGKQSYVNKDYKFTITKDGSPIAQSPVTISVTNGSSNEILIDNLDPGDYEIIETDSAGLRLTSFSGGKAQDTGNKSITVTVTAGKMTKEQLEEAAKATFVNDYSETSVTLKKIDKANLNADNPALLKGASFTITKYKTEVFREIDKGWGENGSKTLSDVKDKETDTYPLNGSFTFSDLPAGYYMIEEIAFPDGYIKLNNNPRIEIGEDMKVYLLDSDGQRISGNATEIIRVMPVTETQPNNIIRIGNEPGAALPHTGGPGTRLFTILGSILILGAGVLLWRRRRTI